MPFSNFTNFVTQTWPPRPKFTDKHVPAGSQAGRVFLVTGGNAGIGYELCKMLVKSGAKVYMASRSKEKADAAIASIMAGLVFLQLDLNDLESVREAARRFSQHESRLDVLWNNAGLGAYRVAYGERTAQGFEPLIGVNCIATLLFTQLLLPQLKAAAAATEPVPGRGQTRVLWLASGLVDSASVPNGVNFDLLDRGIEDRIKNYAVSKAGCWLLGREFARRHERDGIVSIILNPGNLKAGSFENTPRYIMFFMNRLLYEPKFGAYTELFAGLSPDITMRDTGGYVYPWGRLRSDNELKRQDIVKADSTDVEGGVGHGARFWNWCEAQWGGQ
ncbi:hypothetical protein F4778DRAFT_774872 [Xylariomycetidae sp. FL2044]|nr:hypothetical protein F4778DRAFT_774872 [Xylariomycetidae sp. FL2044]